MSRLTIVLVFASASASATPRAGFAAYRDARLLCSEHVVGKGLEIEWSSYASKDDVATIVASYEKATGRTATTGAKHERHLEWDADHSLDVYAADHNDDFPHCDHKPGRGEVAVILMSNAMRRP